jgi:hypothetical protein
MAREKQIEFPPQQTHLPILTPVLLGVAVVCIVVTVILVLAVDEGPFIGPW